MTPPHTSNREKPPDRLTSDEIEWLRENKEWLDAQRKSSEHEAWLRGRIKVVWPWVITILAAIVATGEWLAKHFTTK
jgi:hypothetical protein